MNEDYLFEVNIHKMEIKPVSRVSFFFFVRNVTVLTNKQKMPARNKSIEQKILTTVAGLSLHNIGLLGWTYL